jgi:hypothetical protein
MIFLPPAGGRGYEWRWRGARVAPKRGLRGGGRRAVHGTLSVRQGGLGRAATFLAFVFPVCVFSQVLITGVRQATRAGRADGLAPRQRQSSRQNARQSELAACARVRLALALRPRKQKQCCRPAGRSVKDHFDGGVALPAARGERALLCVRSDSLFGRVTSWRRRCTLRR